MDQVAEVKSKIDIVEVISSYVPLKRAGRNFSGLCPFHSERTPSFMVSPERQAFKCFGCGESGDVFTFLEKMEGWEFRETLEELAKKTGVKLVDFKPTAQSKTREKLIEINKLTAKFYKYILNKHPFAGAARKYLLGRGIDEPLWEKFDLGFAPSSWENLHKFLEKKGFAISDVATAGLIIGRTAVSRGGYYDRFRDRIMFPIKDNKGTILGFSGRLLEGTESERDKVLKVERREAKYINSPETPIFNKGSLLFGLDIARTAIREKNEAVLVEGEFDVLSSVKAGLLNVVASKGTALTEKQVAAIARICERVIICFDTDLAGDAASRRGIELLDTSGVNVKVARMGKFKDPDEFSQADPKGFLKAIDASENVYDYFIESAAGRFDPVSAEGKKKIGQEILPILAKISDDLVRAHYIAKLADVLKLEVSAVTDAVLKKGVLGTADNTPGNIPREVKGVLQEEYFLALLLLQDEVVGDLWELVTASDFENELASKLFGHIHDIIKNSKERKLKRLLANLPGDLVPFVDNLYLVNIGPDFADRELWAQEVTKIAKNIRDKSLRRQQRVISSKLKEAQKDSNDKLVGTLSTEFKKLSEERQKISF